MYSFMAAITTVHIATMDMRSGGGIDAQDDEDSRTRRKKLTAKYLELFALVRAIALFREACTAEAQNGDQHGAGRDDPLLVQDDQTDLDDGWINAMAPISGNVLVPGAAFDAGQLGQGSFESDAAGNGYCTAPQANPARLVSAVFKSKKRHLRASWRATYNTPCASTSLKALRMRWCSET